MEYLGRENHLGYWSLQDSRCGRFHHYCDYLSLFPFCFSLSILQTFPVKGQRVNILGFVDQETISRTLCRCSFNERQNKFSCIFIDEIQNMVIIGYNILYYRSANEKSGILSGRITFRFIGM